MRAKRLVTASEVIAKLYFTLTECLGNSIDKNLYDAILLGTKRIGHAFSLIKHPTLIRLCRERNICCEVCPVRFVACVNLQLPN